MKIFQVKEKGYIPQDYTDYFEIELSSNFNCVSETTQNCMASQFYSPFFNILALATKK